MVQSINGAFGKARLSLPRFDLAAMQANERAQGTHHCGRCEPCRAWEQRITPTLVRQPTRNRQRARDGLMELFGVGMFCGLVIGVVCTL